MLVIAHRGASGIAPENTLSAFQLALDAGADGVELDVQMVEGKAVVLHDRWLQKTTNGQGLASEISLAYLATLDAGGGQKVLMLRDVLSLIKGRCIVNIEVKAAACEYAVMTEVEYAIAHFGFSAEQLLISSFNHHSLRLIKQAMPLINIGALTSSLPLDYASFASQLNAWSVHVCIDFINQSFVDDAHSRGLQIWVYTVNHLEDIRAMRAMGVDAIFTDYPSRAKQFLQQYL